MILNSFILLFLTFHHVYLWDPDAGIIPSYTKQPGVSVTATSGNTSAHNVIDNSDSTHWTSSGCLPTFYFNRPDVNVLLGACERGECNASATPRNDIAGVTNGDVYHNGHISTVIDDNGHKKAFFSVRILVPIEIQMLTVDGVFKSSVDVLAISDNGASYRVASLNQTQSYKAIQISLHNRTISKVELHSDQDFTIRELAAIGPNGCMETLTVDLGQSKEVGRIRTRHWAGSHAASSVDLMSSTDGQQWTFVHSLDPEALHAVITASSPTVVRYIQLRYYTTMRNYNKVYCWEVDAWDINGQWGPKIAAKPQQNTLSSILGVNGIWGWGHSMYSTGLYPDKGPWLYSTIASHARNYHNLNWDVTDPDNDPNYQKMSDGHGTQAKWWLNWDTEYRAWKNASLMVDTSIQFTNKSFPTKTWNNPEQAAYNYGRAFAHHFGPSSMEHLISAMEVGNEPWDYSAGFYATVLKGMSRGAKDGDHLIKVLPGAFQANDKHATGNYIGTRVLPDVAQYVDVINFHTYSYYNNEQGVRTGIFPEHKESSFNSLRNIIRWRDTNMPNAPIWVTEWGWDAPGAGEDCTVPECVTEIEQTLYGIRGLLILARHNVEKATWYFYANSGCTTLYCRSGLTTSKKHNFAKKPIFLGFQALFGMIGDKFFLGVVQEDDNAFIYMFGHSIASHNVNDTVASLLSRSSHLVAWRPDSAGSVTVSESHIPLPHGKNVKTVYEFAPDHQTILPALHSGGFALNGHILILHLTPRPLIVEISDTDSSEIIG